VPDRGQKRTPRERYALILEAAPSAIAPMARIRGALKVLLRRFGLRCVRIERTPPNPAGAASASSSSPIVPTAGSSAMTSALQPVLPTKVRRRRTIGFKVAPPGKLACSACGRSQLRERYRRMVFHYAPLCGLPCSGAAIPAEERREHRGRVHPESCSCRLPGPGPQRPVVDA
jgi:hypothetical protein